MSEQQGQEIPLQGGDVTEGVVRVGDTVRRPMGPHSEVVHGLLGQLEEAEIDCAPRFLGIDEQGREILSFIEGEVAVRPWPEWVADPECSTSVARMLRRLDDALIELGLPKDAPVRSWLSGAPEPVGPVATFMGHRDVTPENTVFRDGRAVAFIDFDMVKPSSRVDEVVNMLLWWAGWTAPADRAPMFAEVDPGERGRLLVDAYELSSEEKEWVVPVSISAAQQAWHWMKHMAEDQGGGWQKMWDEGIGDQIRRREQWLVDEQENLRRAINDDIAPHEDHDADAAAASQDQNHNDSNNDDGGATAVDR